MRRITFFLSLVTLVILFRATEGAASTKTPLIVVGFDGVDAGLTEQWMNEGKLPNLARLRASGTFRPLRPTVPPQTPVSWSTFSTGIDPGRTGIFDFLRRDPATYLPVFAAFEETTEPFLWGARNAPIFGAATFALVFLIFYGVLRLAGRRGTATLATAIAVASALSAVVFITVKKLLPLTRPGVVNRREGIPLWDVAAKAGLRSRIVHVPVTFPATEVEGGHLLAGLGVPDISGRIGKPFYFTSELEIKKGGNEFSIEVVQLEDNRGVIKTEIVGPPNKLFGKPPFIAAPLEITVAEDRKSVRLRTGSEDVTLRAGEWSDWVTIVFPFNRLIKVSGISRFHVISTEPEVRIYLSPINFDPRALPPGFKISAPASWAKALAEKFGPYKTMGWAIDTWAISEGFATEEIFWDDMNWTVTQYRKIFRAFLQEDDDLLIHCFEFPDRVAHVMWRLTDPEHPAYDPALAAKWQGSILKSYELMDSIVGEAMTAAERRKAALIVMSDHGFATWRKSVNYNTWLVQNGYLAVRSGVTAKERNLELLFDQGQFWENVDWTKTRAYALGLGNIYVNLKGREAQGTVSPGAEYDALKGELKSKLEALVDPENGAKPVHRVYRREEIYREFDPNLIPDLFVANAKGYRVSWQTSLGGIQKNLFDPNKGKWSADHCSLDPELVRGIFFYNRKLATSRAPYIADIYPTALGLLGLPAPYRLDGVELK